MQQPELSDHLQGILERSERRVQYINYVLALLLVVTLAWAMYAAWRSGQQEKIESIALVPSSMKVLGPTALCPGDTMTIRYTLDIKGTGIIITDDTVQYANRTVKFSEALRDYIPGDMKRTYESAWTIPEHPAMTANGNDAWHPGLYMRYITVAASNAYISRYTEPASFKVEFLMRPPSECPKRQGRVNYADVFSQPQAMGGHRGAGVYPGQRLAEPNAG
jgi:hypothetical protein